MRRIDAHHHLWRYDPRRDGWIEPGSVLAADFLPDDLEPLLDASGIAAGIVVQAAQDEQETAWLCGLARAHPRIAGVVGWLDLRAPDIAARIARWRQTPTLVGLRHIVQAEPAILEDAAFVAGVAAALQAGLSYDILVYGAQAPAVPGFIARLPPGRLILDHGGKPDIAGGGWQPWADAIRAVARVPHVRCKLSGLVTEADHATWTPAQIERYIGHLFDCFGPERLIFGSDWPVCLLAAPYARVHDLAADFVARHCPQAHDAVFGGNAVTAYGLEP